MNKPVFPSYQELLNEEAVSVPDALRLDTQPNIANEIIATDVWTDRGVFEKEASFSNTPRSVHTSVAMISLAILGWVSRRKASGTLTASSFNSS